MASSPDAILKGLLGREEATNSHPCLAMAIRGNPLQGDNLFQVFQAQRSNTEAIGLSFIARTARPLIADLPRKRLWMLATAGESQNLLLKAFGRGHARGESSRANMLGKVLR